MLYQIIAILKNKIIDIDINEAISCKREFDFESYEQALEISI